MEHLYYEINLSEMFCYKQIHKIWKVVSNIKKFHESGKLNKPGWDKCFNLYMHNDKKWLNIL